jgi:peptide deformylase
MILNILTYPNKFLRGRSQKMRNILSPENQEFIANLKETMLKRDGVGLAARQVGVDQQVFVIAVGNKISTFINARFVYRSFKKVDMEEGCLSIPGIFGIVRRPQAVVMAYYDQEGQFFVRRFDGLAARVIQHEFDHNQGGLFIDKVSKFTTNYDLIKNVKE